MHIFISLCYRKYNIILDYTYNDERDDKRSQFVQGSVPSCLFIQVGDKRKKERNFDKQTVIYIYSSSLWKEFNFERVLIFETRHKEA